MWRYIYIYIRLCVRAHRYTCHQTKYALRRRYVTMCILVYNIYAQKDTYTCTIKLYVDAHTSSTRTWSNACSKSSLHRYVLQSCYTDLFTNSCINVYANISSSAEHAQRFTIAEVRLEPTSHFQKPIWKTCQRLETSLATTWYKGSAEHGRSPLNIYIYIYIYMYMCMYVCMYKK